MRHASLAVLLALTACAHAEQNPTAPPAQAAPPAKAEPVAAAVDPASQPVVEFVSAAATRRGGTVTDTRYSEKPDDAAITAREFAAGVVTWTGQVGFGKGSQYAGVGFNVSILPDGQTVSATSFKSVTFRLASPNNAVLRLRVSGSNEKVRNSGCYPVYVQATSKDLTEYTIPLSKFAPESWCAAQGVAIGATLPELFGFEVADTNVKKAPTTFSVGSITLNP